MARTAIWRIASNKTFCLSSVIFVETSTAASTGGLMTSSAGREATTRWMTTTSFSAPSVMPDSHSGALPQKASRIPPSTFGTSMSTQGIVEETKVLPKKFLPVVRSTIAKNS